MLPDYLKIWQIVNISKQHLKLTIVFMKKLRAEYIRGMLAAWYPSVLSVVPTPLFSEIVKTEIQKTIKLLLLYGRKTYSVTLSKGYRLRVFGLSSGIGW